MEVPSKEKVAEVSAQLDEFGVHRPIKEGLEDEGKGTLSDEDGFDGDITVKVPELIDDETTDEERELPGVFRPERGAGWWGRGRALQPHRKGLVKEFADGAGFPSPGRWKVKDRRLPDDDIATRLRETLREGLREMEPRLPGGTLRKAMCLMAQGGLEESPFPEENIRKITTNIRNVLKDFGHDEGFTRDNDAEQLTEVRLVQSLLKALGDPDHYFGEWWAKGVWLGSPDRPLPRARHLYDRKLKWALKDEGEWLHGDWKANYSSLQEHEEQVLRQYDEEVRDGLMTKMALGEALELYGDNLVIAATGAIAKKGTVPGGEVRVIYDGTNGVFLNYGIKIRDQIKFPTAPDLKAVMAELHEEAGSNFSLVFDISKAHRRIPVLPEEWGRQACQVRGSAAATAQGRRSREGLTGTRPGSRAPRPLSRTDFSAKELSETVYLNKVGTFGVTSAGYWWGRAGGSIMRLCHYLIGFEDALWALLYADDGDLTGRTAFPERGLLLFFTVLAILRLPLSWKKLKGGVRYEWIGYMLDIGRFELGISASRAAWASRWLSEKAAERSVPLGELREGLGRLQFLAGPIEHVRPFLGPLYAWASIGPKWARPKLPVMVVLIMRYLSEELRGNHMMACEAPSEHLGDMFRMDAKAQGDLVVIGGWRVRGAGDPREAEWFSVTLTRATAPWAFARGDPFRTIAALELLGTLVSLVVLVPNEPRRSDASALISLTCSTDNQGNSYLLDRMLTTRYPLGVVLMELAHQMKLRRMVLRARWLPRDENQEADDLTNYEYRHFDPAKRIPVDLSKLGFDLMDSLLRHGDEYMADLERERASEKRKAATRGAMRGAKRKPLRETDPWH